MSVRRQIQESNGVYFITFTCARWERLLELVNGYNIVYKWFYYLKKAGHHIAAYVIMPNHLHAIIAFSETQTAINTIIANGKRFMAYELVKRLRGQGNNDILLKLASWVNKTDQLKNQRHSVFEPSFDRKECYSLKFLKQKADYIHHNPCRVGLVSLPEEYVHSSAKYYYTGVQGVYPVVTHMELQDIHLTSSK